MLIEGKQAERDAVLETAKRMCAAARTAPKAKGIDHILTGILTGEEKDRLAAEMRRLAETEGAAFFARDAANVDASEAVVLIGTARGARGVPLCGFCGWGDCAGMAKAGGHCAYDDVDLGIAVGSAAAAAADARVDSRVMFSAGKAALLLGLLGEKAATVFGIPVSATGKSKYFDR